MMLTPVHAWRRESLKNSNLTVSWFFGLVGEVVG